MEAFAGSAAFIMFFFFIFDGPEHITDWVKSWRKADVIEAEARLVEAEARLLEAKNEAKRHGRSPSDRSPSS